MAKPESGVMDRRHQRNPPSPPVLLPRPRSAHFARRSSFRPTFQKGICYQAKRNLRWDVVFPFPFLSGFIVRKTTLFSLRKQKALIFHSSLRKSGLLLTKTQMHSFTVARNTRRSTLNNRTEGKEQAHDLPILVVAYP